MMQMIQMIRGGIVTTLILLVACSQTDPSLSSTGAGTGIKPSIGFGRSPQNNPPLSPPAGGGVVPSSGFQTSHLGVAAVGLSDLNGDGISEYAVAESGTSNPETPSSIKIFSGATRTVWRTFNDQPAFSTSPLLQLRNLNTGLTFGLLAHAGGNQPRGDLVEWGRLYDPRTGAKLNAISTLLPSGEIYDLFFGVGDVDGDGFEDLLVRKAEYPQGVLNYRQFVLSGRILAEGSSTQNSVIEEIVDPVPFANRQYNFLIPIGDINGDGRIDLATNGGRMYRLGSASGFGPLTQSPWISVSGEIVACAVGQCDFNGNGQDNIVSFTGGGNANSANVGVGVYVNFSAAPYLLSQVATFEESSEIGRQAFPYWPRVVFPGDVDGDGRADLVIAANHDTFHQRGSYVYVYALQGANLTPNIIAAFNEPGIIRDEIGFPIAALEVSGPQGRPGIVRAAPMAPTGNAGTTGRVFVYPL